MAEAEKKIPFYSGSKAALGSYWHHKRCFKIRRSIINISFLCNQSAYFTESDDQDSS